MVFSVLLLSIGQEEENVRQGTWRVRRLLPTQALERHE